MGTSGLDKFGALLHSPWIPGQTGEDIVGYWAEDGSTFAVKVPHQLRDLLVTLQQALSDKYLEIERKRRELNELTESTERLFK